MSIDEVAAMYRNLNEKLKKYDWFVSPYYSQFQLDPLIELLDKRSEPTDRYHKEKVGKEIAGLLEEANLEPHFRACIMYESYITAPSVKNFSHLVEVGLFELYTFNFITCIAVWVPTVEGILRSLLKIPIGPTVGREYGRLNTLRAADSNLSSFLKSITETTVGLLKSSFYLGYTDDQNPPANRFNRHFISHLLSNEPFYCRSNCLRLLNIIDSLLAIDLITTGNMRTFFEGKSDGVKKREQYYSYLQSSASPAGETTRMELLTDHPCFNKEYFMA